MEPIQQEGQQLLRVLLLVAGELGGEATDLRLKTKHKTLLWGAENKKKHIHI